MKLHQVLTGAANVFDDYVTVSTGIIHGNPFISLGSGYDVVVLDKDFHRVQILPFPLDNATSIVRCVACSSDGKIVASYGERMVIFKPIYHGKSKGHKLPYIWEQSDVIISQDEVRRMCWDRDGRRLLVGNSSIQMWKLVNSSVGYPYCDEIPVWTCVWERKLAVPIHFLDFSPDGHYFASVGVDDRMVKIWYHSSKVEQATWRGKRKDSSSSKYDAEVYNFVYILHPKVVTGLCWRQIGIHMPPFCVPNVLLTSCADNVSRLWTETVKQKPQHHHHSTSFKTVTRSKSEDASSNKTSAGKTDSDANSSHASRSSRDFYPSHHLISMFHFHLSAIINPVNDIALLSTIPTSSIFGRSFQLQWLNNKEIMFTSQMEELLHHLRTTEDGDKDERVTSCMSQEADDFAVLEEMDLDGDIEINEEGGQGGDGREQVDEDLDTSEKELSAESQQPAKAGVMSPVQQKKEGDYERRGIKCTIPNKINQLLHEWCKTGDTLFCIHPADGSLLIWLVDYLDDFNNAYYRQCQVSFASRIPWAFSKADANSLYWTRSYHISRVGSTVVNKITGQKQKQLGKASILGTGVNKLTGPAGKGSASTQPDAYLLSAHSDGSLNTWHLVFSDGLAFTAVASIAHLRRNCGPRFETKLLVTHPTLPLTIGTSKNNLAQEMTHAHTGISKCKKVSCVVDECSSELILWRSNFVSPLSQIGGMTETARISSIDSNKFNAVAWFPLLFQHSLVSISGVDGSSLLPATPCTGFVGANATEFELYQVILDAKTLLSYLTTQKLSEHKSICTEALSECIASEQSGTNSSCIIKVCDLACPDGFSSVDFLHVFTSNSIQSNNYNNDRSLDKSFHWSSTAGELCYVVAVTRRETDDNHWLNIWSVCLKVDDAPLPSPQSLTSDSSVSPSSPTKSSKFKNAVFVSSLVEHQLLLRQELPLPVGVKATHFSAATDIATTLGHNSTCPAPYWFSVACSDQNIRFFKCCRNVDSSTVHLCIEEHMMKISCFDKSLLEPPKILSVSNATPYRLAWISDYSVNGGLRQRKLTIAESESSGGEKWHQEYTILLEDGPQGLIGESNGVFVTWMSLENGYYLLTVVADGIVYLYNHQFEERLPDISSATLSTVAVPKWTLLTSLELCSGQHQGNMTALTWAWDGMLLVGVKNELRVYSQWEASEGKETDETTEGEAPMKDARLQDSDEVVHGSTFQRAVQSLASLPQYHPKHLIELLNLGKSRRVKAILSHLVRCVAGREAADAAAEAGDVIRGRTRTLSRSFSTLSTSPPEGRQGFGDITEALSEILAIPPLPLYTLLAADKDESANMEETSDEVANNEISTDDYSELFERRPTISSVSSQVEGLQEIHKGTGMSKSAVYFGLAQSHLLAQHLSRIQLPGLSSMEQLYLLALSDTVASTKKDLEGNSVQERGIQFARRPTTTDDNLSHWGGGGGYATTGAIGATAGSGGDAVDECGLKFLLAMRHHTALQKSLPPAQQAVLNLKGLPSVKFAWAFHSDCEEELLAMVPGMLRGEPTWKELKAHGVVWWIKSTETLKRMAEKIAKAHFHIHQNPLDCAIFYLAMKKKTLLCGLYRSLRDKKMSDFFSHNFAEERWRKAALKNAYSLLGMQRFEHAAAFFLLANSLWDAIQICILRLNDIQLALLIARLFEGPEEDAYQRILSEYVLGDGSNSPNPDPFLRSIAYWRLKDYNEALDTLLSDPSMKEKGPYNEIMFNQMASMGHPDIFNYYVFLRSHPLLRRRHFDRHDKPYVSKSNKIGGGIMKNRTLRRERSVTDVVLHTNPATPAERKLYFLTACSHLNAGMPDLALEVLLLLPKELEFDDFNAKVDGNEARHELVNVVDVDTTEDMIITGTLQDDAGFGHMSGKSDHADSLDWSKPVSNGDIDWSKPVSSNNFDWGTPVSLQTSDNFDWSQPIATQKVEDFDWGLRTSTLAFDSKESEDTESFKSVPDVTVNGDQGLTIPTSGNVSVGNNDAVQEKEEKSSRKRDVIAMHLKYIAILKCLVEELRSLPTKCQVERCKLRPTVADLLEKEVELLHQVCDYNATEDSADDDEDRSRSESQGNAYQDSQELPIDKYTLAQKAERVTKQIQWLGRNQRILTTLYNCCSTQGVGGESLPAICLELLLLLHELEHQHVLSAPLRAFSAGPSAPPLLLASMATFSLVASPVAYLQSMTHDILRSLYSLHSLPTVDNPAPSLAALESMSLSLSSCLYHSLCGGQEDHLLEGIRKGELLLIGKENKEGRMMRITQSALADGIDKALTEPTSAPSSWPGVHFLRSILSASNKEGSRNLKLLLCEAAVAVYLSLLVSACSRMFVNQLYRLMQNRPSQGTWGRVFGGGTKVILSIGGLREKLGTLGSQQVSHGDDKKRFDTARMKWNYRLLGKRAALPSSGEDKPVQQELFVAPMITLYDYFQRKPSHLHYEPYEYDSDDSCDSSEGEEYEESDPEFDDDFDATDSTKKPKQPTDHMDCNSYSWLLMHFGILKVVFNAIQTFVTSAGVELTDLPSQSPLLYSSLKLLIKWQQQVMMKLDNQPDPGIDYIPVFYSNMGDGVTRGGITLQRFKALLDPGNSPFRSTSSKANPAKRLWHCLVHQECLKQTFLYYAFSRSADVVEQDQTDYQTVQKARVLYRDQEPISCFAFNGANPSTVALATAHDIVEIDIAPLLRQDVLSLRDEITAVGRPASTISIDVDDETLLVSRHADSIAAPAVLMKKPQSGVRRMDSHPNLPYYITGGSDGSVKMWEYGHQDHISLFRSAGTHDRITRVHFNSLGNKFGVTDDSGYFTLWLISNTSSPKPSLTLKCHSRQALDFTFVGSTSLIATAGYSSEGRNICLWDTLLPARRSLVHAFTHHEHGAQSILYMPGQQCILSGGRKGNVCIFDVRQRRLLHMFTAHDSAIKSLALDSREDFFASGFADGDIKLWGLGVHELYDTFPKEHTRNAYLRNMSTGVQSLAILSNSQLFSCGSDGTFKWRSLSVNELDSPVEY